MKHFGPKNNIRKNDKALKKFLNYINTPKLYNTKIIHTGKETFYTSVNFYYFPPPHANFLKLPNFISKNRVYFFFHIFWHAPIPPSCWMLHTACINSSRLNPGRREKIKLNFYFHTSLWCHKRFCEGLSQMHGALRVNSLLISLSGFHFSNLLRQAKSLT